MPPPNLATRLLWLPPILYKTYQNPISSCSKAPWGLSVLSRVTCIFTGITISPGLLPRQRPSRYAFRAGRNLPDKEFRYLRTVIVTAAVHRGFSSKLRSSCKPLTSPFNLPAPGRRQTLYVVFDFAEPCVFSKQLPGPLHCNSFPHATARITHGNRAPLIPKLRG